MALPKCLRLSLYAQPCTVCGMPACTGIDALEAYLAYDAPRNAVPCCTDCNGTFGFCVFCILLLVLLGAFYAVLYTVTRLLQFFTHAHTQATRAQSTSTCSSGTLPTCIGTLHSGRLMSVTLHVGGSGAPTSTITPLFLALSLASHVGKRRAAACAVAGRPAPALAACCGPAPSAAYVA